MRPGSLLPLALMLTVGEKEISDGLEESGLGKPSTCSHSEMLCTSQEVWALCEDQKGSFQVWE